MSYPKACPHCGEDGVRRSRRRSVEHVLGLFGVYPYRCDACMRRFYGFRRAVGRERGAPSA